MLEGGAIDYPQLEKMVDMFLERGFTYFDTAYGYVNGESEVAAGKTLVQRHPRESFQLATKLPAWAGAKTEEEAKAMFTTSLERTGAGYFDFYLLHNLGATRTDSFYKYHIWEYVAEQKAKGLIKHVGFSFHDKADVLDEILAKHHEEIEFVQLQINYADWESGGVQSRKCHEVAWGKYGKPVVIMEPVKGGMLANPVTEVREVFDAADNGLSYRRGRFVLPRRCRALSQCCRACRTWSRWGTTRRTCATLSRLTPPKAQLLTRRAKLSRRFRMCSAPAAATAAPNARKTLQFRVFLKL